MNTEDFRIRKTGDRFVVRQHEAGRWIPVGDGDGHPTRSAAAAWITAVVTPR